jgi:Zn-dependent peptidase ImmA (M78 family)
VRAQTLDALAPPHEQGYDLANRLRAYLRLVDAPLTRVRDAAQQLGVTVDRFAGADRFRTAIVDAGCPTVLWNEDAPQIRRVAVSRFAIAAGVGRLLFERGDEAGTFGAANGEHSRLFETRRANAFAAELLLPRRALEGPAAGMDLVDICAEYGISAPAARWHIHNRVGAGDWRLALEAARGAAPGDAGVRACRT